MTWKHTRPFAHAPLVATMFAGLFGVACEPAPDVHPETGARRQLPPPDAEYVTDPATGRQLRRNPNRRVIPPTEYLPEGVSALARDGVSTFTDATGRVHIQVVECADLSVTGRHLLGFVCETDPEFVVVGGGAKVEQTEPAAGALLYESRPLDGNLSGWVASSKEHGKFDVHRLRVFAIGLRLNGISDFQLWQNMTLRSSMAETAVSKPDHAELFPDGRFTVVGGGAAMAFNPSTCMGNLLTGSMPHFNGWRARGKDHVFGCPAHGVAYAIGLKPFIDGFGPLEIHLQRTSQFFDIPEGARSHTTILPSGFAPAGIGGQTLWQGDGRLLTEISPGNRSVTVSDKDHLKKSGKFTLEAAIFGIRAL